MSMSSTQSSGGRELLLEIKRHQDSSGLPPYNLKVVRQCLDDLHRSFERLSEEVRASASDESPSIAARPSMLWHHACIQRQKRCLLAYHKHRLDTLKNQVIRHPTADTSTWSSNTAELDFCKSYQQLRQKQGFLHHDTPPPVVAHSLQVRCLVTLGQVVLESGRNV
eukprot:CAMPEP_0170421360 /NCGR_PEP_ID=MMETSP0117_2-20130122/35854_1 /TAXON_ID=400756 /ORGANISM="Durinskia baltica, Strain CSIRO CS-38" /LENGTH=165 /DNA_ID=CAMNT_0010679899 /DNA_START=42 /DNA_END=536 /DNA_ORIENTATION=+